MDDVCSLDMISVAFIGTFGNIKVKTSSIYKKNKSFNKIINCGIVVLHFYKGMKSYFC